MDIRFIHSDSDLYFTLMILNNEDESIMYIIEFLVDFSYK